MHCTQCTHTHMHTAYTPAHTHMRTCIHTAYAHTRTHKVSLFWGALPCREPSRAQNSPRGQNPGPLGALVGCPDQGAGSPRAWAACVDSISPHPQAAHTTPPVPWHAAGHSLRAGVCIPRRPLLACLASIHSQHRSPRLLCAGHTPARLPPTYTAPHVAAEDTGGQKGQASWAGFPLCHLTPVCGLRLGCKCAFALP